MTTREHWRPRADSNSQKHGRRQPQKAGNRRDKSRLQLAPPPREDTAELAEKKPRAAEDEREVNSSNESKEVVRREVNWQTSTSRGADEDRVKDETET